MAIARDDGGKKEDFGSNTVPVAYACIFVDMCRMVEVGVEGMDLTCMSLAEADGCWAKVCATGAYCYCSQPACCGWCCV